MTDINWTTTGHSRGTSMQAWVDNPGHSDILLGPDDTWVSLAPWANTRTVAKWEEAERPGPDWHWIPGHWRRYAGKGHSSASGGDSEGRTFEGDLAQKMQDPEFVRLYEAQLQANRDYLDRALSGAAICEWEPERWAKKETGQ